MTPDFWQGRSVFVTGHTGFKGPWLCLWLHSLGARVHGYASEPPTSPSLFVEADIAGLLSSHTVGDVRDGAALERALQQARPEVVFHLAAQSLVRLSYAEPAQTYAVNVMGTVNLLEAVRATSSVRAVVNVTTDKCYENREWPWGYRENEALGGYDPYSNSKACSELVTAAYRDSFLAQAGVAVATGRAGNVIGGGDWATDRLLPDFFRAADAGVPVQVRNPNATRPWQHVLEPLSGYMSLAQHLLTAGAEHASGWNFGPADDDARPVRWILDRLVEQVPGTAWQQVDGPKVHEAHMLKLDSSKARHGLGWRPRWALQTALEKTVEWHLAWRAKADMRATCLQQVRDYEADA